MLSIVRRSAAATPALFPLSIHASGRYLIDAQSRPFLIQGDTPWSLAVQLTDNQITTYLQDRARKGYSAILFNAIEHWFTSQSPEYKNVDGSNPFTSMTDFASGLNSSYWARIDHIVNTAKPLGILCIINPAYLGFSGTEEGWDTEVSAESDADLQTYGAALANRYTQGNVAWCMGGDQTPGSTLRDKQWQIITGIRTVRTTDLVAAHGAPTDNVNTTWGSKTGFNLNTCYPGDDATSVYPFCATAYAVSGPKPFLMLEAVYEQERGTPITAAGLRRQTWQALLSGACGQFFGNNPIWHFESPNRPFTYSGTWTSNLDSTGNANQTRVRELLERHQWWKLEPKTGTELVTTSLSSGDTRICPALASDGAFAMVWKPGSGAATVNMAALTATSSIRARIYDASNGTYSAVAGSPFSNSGTQSISWPGEGVLVLDKDQ